MNKFIKTITLSAAFALLATGAFAAGKSNKDTTTADVQAWASLNYFANSCGIDITIEKATPGNSTLTIYDGEGHILLTDQLTLNAETIQKRYLLTDVTDGDYTIEVTANNNVVEKTIELRSDESDTQLYTL